MRFQRQLILVGPRSGWLARIGRHDAGGFGRELELRGMRGQVLLAATEDERRWRVSDFRDRAAVLLVDGERSLDSARELAGDPSEAPPLVVVARNPTETDRLKRFLASRAAGDDHRSVVVEWSDDALQFRKRLLRDISAAWAARIRATGRNVVFIIDDDSARFVEGGAWYARLVDFHPKHGVFCLPCTLRAEDELDRLRRQVEPVIELLGAVAMPGRDGYRPVLVYVDNVLAINRGHGVDLGRRLALLLKALVPRALVLTASSREFTSGVDGFFDLIPERIEADIRDAERLALGDRGATFTESAVTRLVTERSSLVRRLGLGLIAAGYEGTDPAAWLPSLDELEDEAAPLRRLVGQPASAVTMRVRFWARNWGIKVPEDDDSAELEMASQVLGVDEEAARYLRTALLPTEPIDVWLEEVHRQFTEMDSDVPMSVLAWIAVGRPEGRPRKASAELRANVLGTVPLPRGFQSVETDELAARSLYVKVAPDDKARRRAHAFVAGLICDAMKPETR